MNLRFMPLFLVGLLGTFGCHSRTSENGTESAASSDSRNSKVTLAEVQNLVDKVLKTKTNPSLFFSFEGFCLDVSSQWLPEILSAKMTARLQQTSAVHFFTIAGQKVMRSPTHFFIAFNPLTAEEIILDPTYGQFIEGADKLNLPFVLVSKTVDIKKIYSQYTSKLKIEVAFDPNTGKYDPDEVADVLYSTGRFSKYRTSLR